MWVGGDHGSVNGSVDESGVNDAALLHLCEPAQQASVIEGGDAVAAGKLHAWVEGFEPAAGNLQTILLPAQELFGQPDKAVLEALELVATVVQLKVPRPIAKVSCGLADTVVTFGEPSVCVQLE